MQINKTSSGCNLCKVVIIGGASVAQQCLKAGLVDELEIEVMPILFCGIGGQRLF